MLDQMLGRPLLPELLRQMTQSLARTLHTVLHHHRAVTFCRLAITESLQTAGNTEFH